MSEKLKRPSTSTVARAVGWVTFREIIRDKILYNIFLCAFLLFGVGFLASRLTFIRPERVILDFGLAAVSLSCATIALFVGSSILVREFDRRTIYVALCHPITRFQFICGKFVGLVGVITLNWALLSVAYLIILVFSSATAFETFSVTLFVGIFMVLIQSMVIACIAILFSTFSTTSLSAVYTIGLFLIGNNITQLRIISTRLHSPTGSSILRSVASILPNFEYFNFGTKVTYGLPLDWQAVSLSVLYGLFMIAFFLGFSGLLIQGREV